MALRSGSGFHPLGFEIRHVTIHNMSALPCHIAGCHPGQQVLSTNHFG
jgi:hypothetical protein